VDIEIEDSTTCLRISVADRGPGIAPEELERVFEHFYQVDSSRSGGGHGLGLSIAASIAGAHGGSLKLEARDGGGLVAVLELPREQ